MTDSPFSARQGSPMRRRLMAGLVAGALVATVAIVYLSLIHISEPTRRS